MDFDRMFLFTPTATCSYIICSIVRQPSIIILGILRITFIVSFWSFKNQNALKLKFSQFQWQDTNS